MVKFLAFRSFDKFATRSMGKEIFSDLSCVQLLCFNFKTVWLLGEIVRQATADKNTLPNAFVSNMSDFQRRIRNNGVQKLISRLVFSRLLVLFSLHSFHLWLVFYFCWTVTFCTGLQISINANYILWLSNCRWRMERFSMFGGIHAHLDDMLASQYQSIDWTQHTTCPSSKAVGGTFWLLVPCMRKPVNP